MTLAELEALGFLVTAGQIDHGNANYGFLTPDGPVLTPEGEELAAKLKQETPAQETDDAPRRGRRRKADAEPAEPAVPVVAELPTE